MPRPTLHRTVFIQTSPTPNDHALKFTPTEHTLLPPNTPTIEFLSSSPSVPSPLARHIIAIPGVRSVMFSPDFLTVEKDEEAQWSHIKPEIFALTMEHLLSGEPLLTEAVAERTDTAIQEGDSEIVQMIKELLETRIRPAIMEDGGDIEFRGFSQDGEVLLKLRGACRTCDSSVVTLKNGIEAMMRHYIPEVQSVRQVMDGEEEIALKEFEKLEAKLASKGGEVGA
jgi:NFU1 iron-sulfur cluster scaffold homolog, mitochondrial